MVMNAVVFNSRTQTTGVKFYACLIVGYFIVKDSGAHQAAQAYPCQEMIMNVIVFDGGAR